MIAAAREEITDPRVDFRVEDNRSTDTSGSDAVPMTYVLQFVLPEDRANLLRSICSELTDAAVLVVSEEVLSGEAFVELHEGFKRINGYREMQVAQKRHALENVMRVGTVDTHLSRFEQVGFRRIQVWSQCLNWISIIAEP